MERSLTELVVEMAQRMARQGGRLESVSVSLDTETDDGVTIQIRIAQDREPATGLASRSSSRATAAS
jgi:hypothetical protein